MRRSALPAPVPPLDGLGQRTIADTLAAAVERYGDRVRVRRKAMQRVVSSLVPCQPRFAHVTTLRSIRFLRAPVAPGDVAPDPDASPAFDRDRPEVVPVDPPSPSGWARSRRTTNAGQHIGLVPGGGPQGMTSPVAYWHVPDIDAKLAEVTAAGAAVKEPAHDVGGGRLVATFTDPDGNVLKLLQDR